MKQEILRGFMPIDSAVSDMVKDDHEIDDP